MKYILIHATPFIFFGAFFGHRSADHSLLLLVPRIQPLLCNWDSLTDKVYSSMFLLSHAESGWHIGKCHLRVHGDARDPNRLAPRISIVDYKNLAAFVFVILLFWHERFEFEAHIDYAGPSEDRLFTASNKAIVLCSGENSEVCNFFFFGCVTLGRRFFDLELDSQENARFDQLFGKQQIHL